MIFVNYSGRPFMEDIWENRKLKWLLGIMYSVATCCVFDASDELRTGLELVPFPTPEF